MLLQKSFWPFVSVSNAFLWFSALFCTFLQKICRGNLNPVKSRFYHFWMPFFIAKNLIRKWVPFFPDSAKIDHLYHGRTADALRYVLPPIQNWWPFCSEQLPRQIIHQNARIFKRNWLIPSQPAISSIWN